MPLGAGHERIQVFHIDSGIIQGLQGSGKLAGGITDLDTHHLGDFDQITLLFQYHFSGCFVIDDDAQDSKTIGFSNGKSPEVDLGIGKGLSNGNHGTLLVLNEYG